MTPLAAYLLLFLAVGIGFIFVHLLAGKLIRPSKPSAEKGTVYECGEPTIGSAWVQFDLRFYVVALLFVIFDVEVAFFFPWAEVFGKANAVANAEKPTTAAEFREYSARVLDLAAPANTTMQQSRDVKRHQAVAGRTIDGKPVLDAEGNPAGGLTDEQLTALLAEQATLTEKAAKVKGGGPALTNIEAAKVNREGPLTKQEFEKNQRDARFLAQLALGEVLVFFGVLLVGFAYLWRRGDLQWVRSLAAERPEAVPPTPTPPPVSEPAVPREPVGAGHH
jgi:NADH-quinone oxidoreductase subunit A